MRARSASTIGTGTFPAASFICDLRFSLRRRLRGGAHGHHPDEAGKLASSGVVTDLRSIPALADQKPHPDDLTGLRAQSRAVRLTRYASEELGGVPPLEHCEGLRVAVGARRSKVEVWMPELRKGREHLVEIGLERHLVGEVRDEPVRREHDIGEDFARMGKRLPELDVEPCQVSGRIQ